MFLKKISEQINNYLINNFLIKKNTNIRISPSESIKILELDHPIYKDHILSLMRINHTGEICAQGIYYGQLITAKSKKIKIFIQKAMQEEIDHLCWCEARIYQLGGCPSLLNPIFYCMSFLIGFTIGLIDDDISLGLIAAIEEEVCKHLEQHLNMLSNTDKKTRVILETMLIEEANHWKHALDLGGINFPNLIKTSMSMISKVMTKSTYYI